MIVGNSRGDSKVTVGIVEVIVGNSRGDSKVIVGNSRRGDSRK